MNCDYEYIYTTTIMSGQFQQPSVCTESHRSTHIVLDLILIYFNVIRPIYHFLCSLQLNKRQRLPGSGSSFIASHIQVLEIPPYIASTTATTM